jgi:hypothetical protein
MTTNILPALNDLAAFAINYVKISLRNPHEKGKNTI